ncbi:hypothetical protein F5Y01DRAFT_320952 [Xylaria sp. FL0043]|nr:hypothetical protein F5Y01DRAFT_320952 [Xylaria sp. FL0043]
MPSTVASLDFLSRSPLYQEEKPYHVFLSVDQKMPTDDNLVLTNVQWQPQEVVIRDTRDHGPSKLEESGFEVIKHSFIEPLDINTAQSRIAYLAEVTAFLEGRLYPRPEFIVPIECKVVRRNMPIKANLAYDVNNALAIEGVPVGVHDYSLDRLQDLIFKTLTPTQREKYMTSEYSVKVINTWRPLLPVVEDRPLAFCDYRSIDPDDLVPVDNVFPHKSQELYYLHYNPDQQWFWTSKQKKDEVLLMIMFDSETGGNARYCPHVSFQDPDCAKSAPPRQSVETRTIVFQPRRSSE